MKELKERLPVTMEAAPAHIQAADWGEMKSAYMRMGEGVDFTPMLEGLPEDLCQCPHWGYVLNGTIQVRYTDGTEESIGAGQIYYLPPGHTVWFEEETEYVEFSPRQEMDEVFTHVGQKMQAA
jgi:ethanolamine utilization protein EutQ (cupin superfamily)